MLDLNKDVPIREDISAFIQHKHQEIRDILLEIEQAQALLHDTSVLLTREETANKLRCEPGKIPSKIPRIRVGKQRLFQLGDIEQFITEKKK